jgi:hypothetical protein
MEEDFVKTVLHNIFGILSVIRYPQRCGKNSGFVTKHQFLESLRISDLCGSYERALGISVYADCTTRFHDSNLQPFG